LPARPNLFLCRGRGGKRLAEKGGGAGHSSVGGAKNLDKHKRQRLQVSSVSRKRWKFQKTTYSRKNEGLEPIQEKLERHRIKGKRGIQSSRREEGATARKRRKKVPRERRPLRTPPKRALGRKSPISRFGKKEGGADHGEKRKKRRQTTRRTVAEREERCP